jgi:hypothetical protein
MTPVITISNRIPHEPYYFFPQFMASCTRQGFQPVFLGGPPQATGWKNPLYKGLMSKPKLLLEYLLKEGSKFEHVIVCDAWDIIWLTTPEEVIYNFKGIGRPIVFNAERNCFPRADFKDKFTLITPQDSPYRFLNSGFFVGETAAVIQMLQEMHLENIPDDSKNPDGSWNTPNDQEFYQQWFLETAKGLIAGLDYRGILCQSLHDAGPREFAYIPDRKRVVSLLTGNEPCVVHGNGNGKEWLKKFITWLNL